MAILKKLAWIFRWTTSPVSGIGLIPWQHFLHWVGPTESETSGMFWRSLIALLLPGVIIPHTELIAVLIPAIEYGLKTLNALAAHGTPKVCPNIYWHKLQTECLPDLVVSLPTMSFFWSRPLFLSLSYAKIHWWYGQGPKLIQVQSTYVALLQTKCQDEGVMSISLFRSPRSNHVIFYGNY